MNRYESPEMIELCLDFSGNIAGTEGLSNYETEGGQGGDKLPITPFS